MAITTTERNMPIHDSAYEYEASLVPTLASFTKYRKFFLVLDGMWGNVEWSNMLKAPFSHDTTGSRVLITTRHDVVA